MPEPAMTRAPRPMPPSPDASLLRTYARRDARLIRIEQHAAFCVCLGIAMLIVLIFAGIQFRYDLPLFWVDALYTGVLMALVWAGTRIYLLDRD